MKNIKTREEKFYEIMGVRKFKNFLLKLHLEMHGQSSLKRATNYRLGKLSAEAAEDFKTKGLRINTAIHGTLLLFNGYYLMQYSMGAKPFTAFDFSVQAIAAVMNGYCLMLQRYNVIRINRVLKKNEERRIKKS